MPYKYPSLRTTLPVAGYYARLDAAAAATDQFTTDGANDGTLTNGATRANDNGLAYSFNGTNNFISVAHSTSLNPLTTAFALSAWIKPTNANQFAPIFQKRMNDNSITKLYSLAVGENTYLGTTGKKIGLALFFNGASQGIVADTSADVVDGNWHHVLAVWSGSAITIYIDGVSVSLTSRFNTGPFNTLTPDGPLRIGANVASGGAYFNGLMDDMLYLPYAPTATQAGFLASQRGAIYQLIAGSSPINGQSLIRPADIRPAQLLIG